MIHHNPTTARRELTKPKEIAPIWTFCGPRLIRIWEPTVRGCTTNINADFLFLLSLFFSPKPGQSSQSISFWRKYKMQSNWRSSPACGVVQHPIALGDKKALAAAVPAVKQWLKQNWLHLGGVSKDKRQGDSQTAREKEKMFLVSEHPFRLPSHWTPLPGGWHLQLRGLQGPSLACWLVFPPNGCKLTPYGLTNIVPFPLGLDRCLQSAWST